MVVAALALAVAFVGAVLMLPGLALVAAGSHCATKAVGDEKAIPAVLKRSRPDLRLMES